MVWSGHSHNELSEGSPEKLASVAVYFYDAAGPAVAGSVALCGTVRQAGLGV